MTKMAFLEEDQWKNLWDMLIPSKRWQPPVPHGWMCMELWSGTPYEVNIRIFIVINEYPLQREEIGLEEATPEEISLALITSIAPGFSFRVGNFCFKEKSMDEDKKTEVGTVVCLNSGGPLMTVEQVTMDVTTKAILVQCCWMDTNIAGTVSRAKFVPESLRIGKSAS
jgi:uncharacterized protein YodC (DUF2158 family)